MKRRTSDREFDREPNSKLPLVLAGAVVALLALGAALIVIGLR